MAETHTEPWRWNVATVRDQIERHDINCRDVTKSVLARLAVVNPDINAVVDVMSDEALATADQLDEAAASRSASSSKAARTSMLSNTSNPRGDHRTAHVSPA